MVDCSYPCFMAMSKRGEVAMRAGIVYDTDIL